MGFYSNLLGTKDDGCTGGNVVSLKLFCQLDSLMGSKVLLLILLLKKIFIVLSKICHLTRQQGLTDSLLNIL